MNLKLLVTGSAALGFIALAATAAEQPLRLSANGSVAGLSLTWSATVQQADGSIERPYFELQRSTDLLHRFPISYCIKMAITKQIG